MRWRAIVLPTLLALAALAACGGGSGDDTTAPSTTTSTTTPVLVETTARPPTASSTRTEIAIRFEVAVGDVVDFAEVVMATLTDPRGWSRAGFAFVLRDDAPYTVVLAEGPEVDARCLPYDTGGRYSCQIGPVVALNADRWRRATPQWTGTLDEYRQMLVNHEVGHLLGQHHVVGGCTTPGEPSPIMVQQSTNLDGCLANPWPLPWEITCAASGVEPLAPPYEPDPAPRCDSSTPRS